MAIQFHGLTRIVESSLSGTLSLSASASASASIAWNTRTDPVPARKFQTGSMEWLYQAGWTFFLVSVPSVPRNREFLSDLLKHYPPRRPRTSNTARIQSRNRERCNPVAVKFQNTRGVFCERLPAYLSHNWTGSLSDFSSLFRDSLFDVKASFEFPRSRHSPALIPLSVVLPWWLATCSVELIGSLVGKWSSLVSMHTSFRKPR